MAAVAVLVDAAVVAADEEGVEGSEGREAGAYDAFVAIRLEGI